MEKCIFCQIISGKLPSKPIFESENIIVIPDINPAADIHLLIVPKKHITAMGDITSEYGELLVEIYQTVKRLVKDNNLTDNLYRVVVNGGKAQHIPHLHFHFLGGQWKKFI